MTPQNRVFDKKGNLRANILGNGKMIVFDVKPPSPPFWSSAIRFIFKALIIAGFIRLFFTILR